MDTKPVPCPTKQSPRCRVKPAAKKRFVNYSTIRSGCWVELCDRHLRTLDKDRTLADKRNATSQHRCSFEGGWRRAAEHGRFGLGALKLSTLEYLSPARTRILGCLT